MLHYQLISPQLLVVSTSYPAVTCSIKGWKRFYAVWFSTFALFMHVQTSQAQFSQPHPQPLAKTDSSHGYWRLKTQAASRNTLIQFFGADGQLLYGENLPEKWVKLSRKNQKKFDQLLEQLLANQLVASRIKTETLPPSPAEPPPFRAPIRSNTARNSTAMTASYQVHAYVNPRGKLYLIVANPNRLRYKIIMADQKDRTLYEEFTNHEQYRRKLDLSPLPYDAYKVIVQIDNHPIIYTVKRQDNRFAYGIQLNSVTSNEGSHAQSRDTLSLIKPAVIDL